jgi:hypothetical protein
MLIFWFFTKTFFILHSWRPLWTFLSSLIAPLSENKTILLLRFLRLQLFLSLWCRLTVKLVNRCFKFLRVDFLFRRWLLLLIHSVNRHKDRFHNKNSLLQHWYSIFFFLTCESLKFGSCNYFRWDVWLARLLKLSQQVSDWFGDEVLCLFLFAKQTSLVDSLVLVYVDVWALFSLDRAEVAFQSSDLTWHSYRVLAVSSWAVSFGREHVAFPLPAHVAF